MISMTGFAYREKSGQDFSVSVEIKGVNSRYLELNVNLPPWLGMYESKIREIISSSCNRGKADVSIRVREHNVPVNININKNAAKAYYSALVDIAKELGIKEKPSLSSLMEMEGILEIEKTRDNDRYWKEIEPLFDETMKIFCQEREREGKHTEADILYHLGIIETSLKTVASFAPAIEQTLKDNIKNRFNEMLGNQVDENKVLAETASLLLKYTISEEISRLDSHLSEFRKEAERNTRPGKKLDFLSQEINREINTIGSKSAIIDVTNEVVKMKETLENIREQLRNIE
ncbi:MAG: YicC family protein [Treponema sp.]|nr:YicC family protein [Treponema sp.]MCL2237787.1 YicC family protein [Treponema sp.]